MFAGRGTFATPSWWRASRRLRRDDTGSMPIAMLITLVGVTLSATLTTMVTGQLRDSRRQADRTASVAAAQAGLDAGLAKIRAAVTSLAGDITKLPCTDVNGTLSAITGASTSASPTYTTSIGYFLVDPSGLIGALGPIGDLTNINGLLAGAQTVTGLLTSLGQPVTGSSGVTTALNNAIGCVSGVLKQVPLYGLLRSTGTVGGVSRTVYATYTFHGNNGQYCIGSQDTTGPTVTEKVEAVLCSGPDTQVSFIYPTNLSLALTTTVKTSVKNPLYPYGLCITAATQAVGVVTKFQPCSATVSTTQQWQREVNAQTFYGTADGINSSNLCLSVSTPNAPLNSPIVLAAKSAGDCGIANVTGKAFVPDATAGAGAAGVGTGQFVNYSEVGRCLDLTNEDVSGAWFTSRSLARALIVYPCKQAFSGGVFWNHKWTAPAIPAGQYEATGQVYTVPASGTYAGKPYCLNSPGSAGGYVWVADCSVGGSALQWTIYDAAPLASQAYQVTDFYGNCLEAAGTLGTSYQYSTWSEVITAPCNGSDIQKWNRPASAKLGPLTGMQEK
jgi:hypothetical protein